MITISVTNCPPNLRGDLTKWLIEINTGVYVGKVNAKVRDELWKRVCDNIKLGQATMVYSTNNEQGFDFRLHNSERRIVDYEGMKLIKIPYKKEDNQVIKGVENGFSKASKYDKIRRLNIEKKTGNYVIVDIETTGLDSQADRIIEIAALKIYGSEIINEFQCLINCSKKLDLQIVELTGITDEMLNAEGIKDAEAVKQFFEFIEDEIIVGYNVKFDIDFIINTVERLGTDYKIKKYKDLLPIAKRKIDGVKDYKLVNVAEYLSIDTNGMHRALRDCYILYDVINKLNEL